MRSNNQESRRIPVFPCQIVWPEQFRTRCGTHDGGRGSHLAFLFLENANKTSCRFPARDRAGQQDSLVKIHSTCFRLNALRAKGVPPRGIFPPPPPLSSFSFSLYLPSPIMEIRPPDDTLGLFWDLKLSVASCHQQHIARYIIHPGADRCGHSRKLSFVLVLGEFVTTYGLCNFLHQINYF